MSPAALLAHLLCAAARLLRRAWLRFEIHETEAYLRDCALDGLVDSLHLRHWRERLDAMRVELATLQEPPASLAAVPCPVVPITSARRPATATSTSTPTTTAQGQP